MDGWMDRNNISTNVNRKSMITISHGWNPVVTHKPPWRQPTLSLWPHRLRDASLALEERGGWGRRRTWSRDPRVVAGVGGAQRVGSGSSHNSAPQQHPPPGTRPAPFSGCSLRSGVQAPPASADAPVFLTPALAPSPLPRVPGQVPTQSLAVPERLSSQTLPPLKPSPLPAPSSSQGLSLAYSEQAKQPWPLSQAPQRPGAQEPGAVRSGTSGLSGPGPCCSPHPPVSKACRGFRGSNFLLLSSRQAGSFVLRKWGCSGSQLRRNKGL